MKFEQPHLPEKVTPRFQGIRWIHAQALYIFTDFQVSEAF